MSRVIVQRGLFALGLCACGRDVPTEPSAPAPASDSQLLAYVIALQDARDRIVPTFGTGAAVDELGSALVGLEAALAEPEAATLTAALARANAAAMGLRADTTLSPDLDVVLLALEQIQITARRPVPTAAAGPKRTDP